MIGMLRGHVESVDAASAIIEVGGVGYEVRMPSADLASMHAGQEIKVYTSLNVSQDAITLFGFGTLPSKRMFLQLQKDFRQMLRSNDSSGLTQSNIMILTKDTSEITAGEKDSA